MIRYCVSVSSLQDSCCRCVVRHLSTVHDIDKLPIPTALQLQIKSFADSSQLTSSKSTLPRHSRATSDAGATPNGTLRRHPLPLLKRLALNGMTRGGHHVRSRSMQLADESLRQTPLPARNSNATESQRGNPSGERRRGKCVVM